LSEIYIITPDFGLKLSRIKWLWNSDLDKWLFASF